MKKIYLIISLLLFCFWGNINAQVVANDENLRTGPMQKIRYDVTKNDEIPCRSYSLRVESVTPGTAGIATFEGDYLVFMPAVGVADQTVDIVYSLTCVEGGSDQATVSVFVRETNLPLNIVQTGEECIDVMPEGVPFGIKLKFSTEDGRPSSGYCIDGFTAPLVGDLNGDGKPEIVMLGVTEAIGGIASNTAHYINIYNGQDGARMYRFDLGGAFTQGTGVIYHRPPSALALADLDKDGIGEIVYTRPDGAVLAYKPVFDGTEITGMTQLWRGNINGTPVSGRAPITEANQFQLPTPYIADINGDGIPEVIVYNKVFNGATGALLMSWQGAAASPLSSSVASNAHGLTENVYDNPTSQANAANIKSVAMTGRRPGNGTYADRQVAVPAVYDIDGDGTLEIITGNRVHKIQINDLSDHTQNTYTTIEGPTYADLNETPYSSATTRRYLSDGFTRVADIDGDGYPDIIVVSYGNNGNLLTKVLVYVWDPRSPDELKAAITYFSYSTNGNFSIPFVGDINGKTDGWDGTDYRHKLPEICILGGGTYINKATDYGARTGIEFHPLTDTKLRQGTAGSYGTGADWDNNQATNPNRRFNHAATNGAGTFNGHIIGLTYDAQETDISKRLKLSWAMEHADRSQCTGVTLFDFDNDGAKDLCYRDETTLRVISPKRANNGAGSDYVTLNEDEMTAGTSIMFKTTVYNGTGFEYPTIADVNMDGSADILVTQSYNSVHISASRGWINVYEYDGDLWAPCPPVWNQGYYNPLHINEDLTVPARPISSLTEFPDGKGNIIRPYNGAWIQQPIVRDGEDYVPIYRHPDAVLLNMRVEASGSNTKITMLVRNDGLASINAHTPIHFYHADAPGSSNITDAVTFPVGQDIFPNEKVELTFTIPGNPIGTFTYCRLVDDGTAFPATGYTDCRTDNNEGYTSLIRAVDDSFSVLKGIASKLDVAANDSIIGNPVLEIFDNPKQGVASISNDRKLVYTPHPDASNRDTLRYLLRCEYDGDTLVAADTAFVYITMYSMPDNIINPDFCYVNAPQYAFTIKSQWNSTAGGHSMTGTLVGDLDGDGLPEIVAYNSGTAGDYLRDIQILNGQDGSLKATVSLDGNISAPNGWYPVMTAAIIDADKNGMGELILCRADNQRIISYEADMTGGVFSMNQKWIATETVTPPITTDEAAQPFVTDLNNDGIPEFIVHNKIFNAATGAYLGYTEASVTTAYVGRVVNKNSSQPREVSCNFIAVADFDGDGMREIAAGGKVYKVSFNNDKTAVTCTVWKQRNDIEDGFTAVADVNLDGKLDVVAVNVYAAGGSTYRTRLNIWTPETGVLIDQFDIAGSANWQSYPFIGDIDGNTGGAADVYPEICVTTLVSGEGTVVAYKLEPSTGQFRAKWQLRSSDTSGSTGITLFDFNNDGINELVYRDETHLRILNGTADNIAPVLALPAGGNFPNGSSFACASGTSFEYPVIVDTDGDGSANICVTCDNRTVVYESATDPWTPTRTIWNQVNYDPTQINEDLTVPVFPIPKNMEFNGAYPYNGSLIQVPTMVDTDFKVVAPAPDPAADSIWTEELDPNTIRIWFRIKNLGVKNTNANLPVALYGVNPPPATSGGTDFMETQPVGKNIPPDGVYAMYFDVNKTSMPTDFSLRIQDDGIQYPADGSYLDCDLNNNVGYIGVTEKYLIANDDRYTVFEQTTLHVLGNDKLPGDCTSPVIEISSTSTHTGSVSWDGNYLDYTPAGAVSADTVVYVLHCGDLSLADTALVYIRIMEKPDNVVDANCYIIPPASVWSIKEAQSIGTSVSTYLPPLVGDLNGDGFPDVVIGSQMNRTPGGTIPGWWSNHISEHVSVFKGPDHATSVTEFQTEHPYYPVMPGVMAIGRVSFGGVEKGIIVVAEGDHLLRAYDMDGGLLWESMESWTDESLVLSETSVAFADFNNDGKAEIYSGNRIFDAETGRLLCRGTANSGLSTHHDQIPGQASPVTFTLAADVYGDSRLELIAGNQVYEVAQDLSSMVVVKQVSPPVCIEEPGLTIPGDGLTQVVDINDDGSLDVVVEKWIEESKQLIYVWNPETETVLAQKLLTNSNHIGIPSFGDIDGEKNANGGKYPEIVLISSNFLDGSNVDPNYNRLFAFKYDNTPLLEEFWILKHSDESGLTGLVLFDFNQDGITEIVYRDEKHLRIINGSLKSHITGSDTTAVYNLALFENTSGTGYEYPVVADADADGSAEILIAGNTTLVAYEGALKIYKSTGSPWAPARKVWNQYAYNAVNVNENLTIPAYPLSPVIRFPGDDGILGTSDDVHPYNNFLQQQTTLSKDGKPLWLTPDFTPVGSKSSISMTGDSVTLTIAAANYGDAPMGAPIYLSLYKESVSASHLIATHRFDIQNLPGDTIYMTVGISDITTYMPMLNIVVRLNDNGVVFPLQPGCREANNELTLMNPASKSLLQKDATLLITPPLQHNGTYANPVAVLFNEHIKYEITAVNMSQSSAHVTISDTLPPYLAYVEDSAEPPHVSITTSISVPHRKILTWLLTDVPAGADTVVSFEATPESGACASQPLFINGAWIATGGAAPIETGNKTYHQGAGVSIVTFSADLGGQVYHAEQQVLDYMTCARGGVLVVPDEGYRFTGWSHEAYTSLRGEQVPAVDTVMRYDTLLICGDVELKAHFEPEEYPIRYYLNGGTDTTNNPSMYTIKSDTIELKAPEKAGDVFIGWTGSSGDEPQQRVIIPKGSTGTLDFYANFLYSGREAVSNTAIEHSENNVWAVGDELYVHTDQAGSIVRIYTMEGILQKVQTLLSGGITKIKLPRGFYIIALNDGVGQKIRIK